MKFNRPPITTIYSLTFLKTEYVQAAWFSYTAMPIIALQIFAIFDVSPGSDADAP